MDIKLQCAKLKVVDVFWSEGTVCYIYIYEMLKERFCYSRIAGNTEENIITFQDIVQDQNKCVIIVIHSKKEIAR